MDKVEFQLEGSVLPDLPEQGKRANPSFGPRRESSGCFGKQKELASFSPVIFPMQTAVIGKVLKFKSKPSLTSHRLPTAASL